MYNIAKQVWDYRLWAKTLKASGLIRRNSHLPIFFILLISVGMGDPPKKTQPQTRNNGRALLNSTQNRPNMYGGYNQFGNDHFDRFFMNQMGGFTYQRGPVQYTPANLYGPGNSNYSNGGRYDSRNGNR